MSLVLKLFCWQGIRRKYIKVKIHYDVFRWLNFIYIEPKCELRYYFTLFVNHVTLFVNHVTLRRLNRCIKKGNVESKVIRPPQLYVHSFTVKISDHLQISLLYLLQVKSRMSNVLG